MRAVPIGTVGKLVALCFFCTGWRDSSSRGALLYGSMVLSMFRSWQGALAPSGPYHYSEIVVLLAALVSILCQVVSVTCYRHPPICRLLQYRGGKHARHSKATIAALYRRAIVFGTILRFQPS